MVVIVNMVWWMVALESCSERGGFRLALMV